MLMVVKQFEFEAAHFLPGYNGKCGNIHGHRWQLEIGLKGLIDDKTGMILDYSRLKQIVTQEIIDILDHSFLNKLKSVPGKSGINFPWEMPTSENIVEWIYQRLQNRWIHPRETGKIELVRLWETSTSYTEWRR